MSVNKQMRGVRQVSRQTEIILRTLEAEDASPPSQWRR
jgi:hypothetical protein